MNILERISNFDNTYRLFLMWLFGELGKDNKRFQSFKSLPFSIQSNYLIQYLEYKEVNVIESLGYYKALYPHFNFNETLTLMIYNEFNNIENNVEPNYMPF